MSDAHLRRERLEEALLPPVVALAIALVAGDLLILTYGEAPGAVWRLILDGTWEGNCTNDAEKEMIGFFHDDLATHAADANAETLLHLWRVARPSLES